MSDHRPHHSELPMRLLLIASFATAIAAFIVAVERDITPEEPAPDALELPAPLTGDPIPEEAGSFRALRAVYALDPFDERHRAAHPRTLRTFRALRAYPGAPPRIPHGFTADEFRTGACKTCHERGGFSPRFGAYVPVTPHPEMTACLQCHLGNDAVTAIPLPTQDPSARCRQCHALSGQRGTTPGLNWQTVEWPALAAKGSDRPPPVIPHGLHFRGNCAACHAGPAAVAEIRTPHADRANCRQCHLTEDAGAPQFRRASTGDAQGTAP